MKEKNEFVDEVLEQLDQLSLQLEKLEKSLQKAESKEYEDSEKLEEAVDSLRRHQIDMREEIRAVRKADGDDWKALRDSTTYRLNQLKDQYARAVTLMPPD